MRKNRLMYPYINYDIVWTFAPLENCVPVKVRVWVRVSVSFRVIRVGAIFLVAIVLEPIVIYPLF